MAGSEETAGQSARSHGQEGGPIPRPGPWAIDPVEAAELDAMLESFARLHPNDCTPWSRPDRARAYLTPRRIASYHDLLAACRRHGVAWDGRDVAEVGSGTGYLLRLIRQAAPSARLVGYDMSRELIELARHLCPDARLVHRDLFDLDDGASFDVVICMEVLEHLIDPDDAMARLLRMVAAGGWLVLTVPDGRLDTYGAHGPYPNGRGYWGHINYWSPESWRPWVARHAGARRHHCGSLATSENYAIILNDLG